MNYSKKRNLLGFCGWFLVALVINMLAMVPMVAREYEQKKRLGLQEVEWDDVMRYTLAIVLGSGVQGLVLTWLLGL